MTLFFLYFDGNRRCLVILYNTSQFKKIDDRDVNRST